MNTKFENNGIRYSLVVTPRSRREVEQEVEIKPDRTLWTSAQKRHRGVQKSSGGWRSGKRKTPALGFLEELTPRQASEARAKGRKRPLIEIKPVPTEHFLESAPLE